MSRVEAAAGMDRLPWLPDEPQPKSARRQNAITWWAAGTLVTAVAAGGLWVGVRSVEQRSPVTVSRARPAATLRLPTPRPAQTEVQLAPQPEVRIAPVPEVRPAPAREVRIAATPTPRKPVHTAPAAPAAKRTQEATAPNSSPADTHSGPAVAPAPPFVAPKPWNPRVARGAAGRLVQIGAFGSVHQAKRGWWFMVHDYPAMAHLPAVVRDTRNSKGRRFYRFDVGTTSQAHSEVLCQRMLRIHLSCAVVGLPWKARVER
jgi:hypothetical protein